MLKSLADLDIDITLCISLKNREDRRTALLESFKESGLNIEFFLVDKDENDPQRGCYDSHRACAQMILDQGYKRALVLEDDCTLSEFSTTTVKRINRFLNANDPEIFYLGVILGKIWLTWRLNIARCRGQGAHAYIVSRSGCRKMLEWEPYDGKGIDNLFSKRFKGYCVFPMICYQNNDFKSDIELYRSGQDYRISKNDVFSQETLHFEQYKSALKYWYKSLFFR